MIKKYISAKHLSLWMRLVKKWKKLSSYSSGVLDSTKLNKFKNLTTLLGINRKVALMALAGGMLVNTSYSQTEQNYVEVTNRGEQILRTPILSAMYPSFEDIDNDGDLDMISAHRINNGIRSYINDDGIFHEAVGEDNPFNSLSGNRSRSKVVLRDLDDDGDLDVISGLQVGGVIEYKENIDGTYVTQSGVDNPFDSINVEKYASPNLEDFDGDGDLDLILGRENGTIELYINEDNLFVEQADEDNPFSSINVRKRSTPVLVDLDGDGDLDLVVGAYSGQFSYFENENNSFTQIIGSGSPFDTNDDVGSASSPTFIDIDNDGDLDLFSNNVFGETKFFQNNEGEFEEKIEMENPLGGIHALGFSSTPSFADFDGDGDLELVSGEYDGSIYYFGNTDNVFGTVTDSLNPFDGSLIFKGVYSAKYVAVDFDNDGDYDIVRGDYYGDFSFMRNNDGVFVSESLFSSLSAGSSSAPTLIDIDNDGDLDLVSGNEDGEILLFTNDDDVFTAQTGIDNPFDSIDVGIYSTPTFSDVDLDNDLDLIVGNKTGLISYFENNDGAFTELIDDNPFGHIEVDGFGIVPTFADIDQDGDLDLIVGTSDGTFLEFRNINAPTGVLSNSQVEKSNIYPNPASSIINTEEGSLEILDLVGNSVLSTKSNGQVDVSGLESGVYLVTQNGKQTKLVIE